MAQPQPSQGSPKSALPGVQWLRLKDIDIADQVRAAMNPEALNDLAEDIKAHGLLQPITVRPTGRRFTVIYGHRRRLACEKAGLTHVYAIVGEASGDDITELQLAENLQREDLSPEDIGRQLTKLYAKYASLDTLALMVNKSKSWVAKHIKFAGTELWWQVRELFDQGHTEDLDLLLAIQDLYRLNYKRGDEAVAQLKAGKMTRDLIRDWLRVERAETAATTVRSVTTSRPGKKPTPRPRTLPQMCREIEGTKKPLVDLIASWTDNERKLFFATAEKAWDEGRKMKAEASELTIAALEYEKPQIKVARMVGILAGMNAATQWSDVQDSYVKALQAFEDGR